MKLYVEGGRPEFVVFYDGVNEIEQKCRKDLTFYSTSQEAPDPQKLWANSPTARGPARSSGRSPGWSPS